MDNNSQLKFQFNKNDHTAGVKESNDLSGDVLIPHHVIYRDQKYIITTIESGSIRSKVDTLKFSKDSEVKIFKSGSFQSSKINNLEIPLSLKKIEGGSFFQSEIHNFIISPNHKYFEFIDGKYLLGKSQENLDEFDLFIYSKFDLGEVTIPPSVKVICENSIGSQTSSINFPENSELLKIEYGGLTSGLTKIEFPKKLKSIQRYSFQVTRHLTEISISPENETFSIIDDTFLLQKNAKSDIFDELIFCRRNAENVIIPNYIKKIRDHAFSYCCQLKSLIFEPNSNLESIDDYAFCWAFVPTTLIIPKSVESVSAWAFCGVENISFVEFLGEDISIGYTCFQLCDSLKVVSFPNVVRLSVESSIYEKATVFVNCNAQIIGNLFDA